MKLSIPVRRVPLTGDSTPLRWYLLGLLAAAGTLILLLRKRKKAD